MLVKILITVSVLMGLGTVWFTIKNVLLNKIYNEIKNILADGTITKEEVIQAIKNILGA